MKQIAVLIATWLAAIGCLQAEERKLWYTKPADESARAEHVDKATTGRKLSREALPLGNGRLGCMPYGGTGHEFIDDMGYRANKSKRLSHADKRRDTDFVFGHSQNNLEVTRCDIR